MLLEKPIKQGSTISIKVTSGEEIIACYEDDTDINLVVSKPATISATPDGKMGIIPWMMTSRAEKFYINKNTVVAYVATEEEISKAYLQSTTNITLAK